MLEYLITRVKLNDLLVTIWLVPPRHDMPGDVMKRRGIIAVDAVGLVVLGGLLDDAITAGPTGIPWEAVHHLEVHNICAT